MRGLLRLSLCLQVHWPLLPLFALLLSLTRPTHTRTAVTAITQAGVLMVNCDYVADE